MVLVWHCLWQTMTMTVTIDRKMDTMAWNETCDMIWYVVLLPVQWHRCWGRSVHRGRQCPPTPSASPPPALPSSPARWRTPSSSVSTSRSSSDFSCSNFKLDSLKLHHSWLIEACHATDLLWDEGLGAEVDIFTTHGCTCCSSLTSSWHPADSW